MKGNAVYKVLESREVPDRGGVVCDEVIELTGPGARIVCPHRLRRVEYRDPETDQTLVFLTNHMRFAASTIARIYKERRQIEMFFNALKQNLKIKTFVGTSSHAVRVQIWTALIAMLVLKYLQLRSNLVALVRWNLFTHRDLWTWLDNPFGTLALEPPDEQLTLALG